MAGGFAHNHRCWLLRRGGRVSAGGCCRRVCWRIRRRPAPGSAFTATASRDFCRAAIKRNGPVTDNQHHAMPSSRCRSQRTLLPWNIRLCIDLGVDALQYRRRAVSFSPLCARKPAQPAPLAELLRTCDETRISPAATRCRPAAIAQGSQANARRFSNDLLRRRAADDLPAGACACQPTQMLLHLRAMD